MDFPFLLKPSSRVDDSELQDQEPTTNARTKLKNTPSSFFLGL